MLVGGIRSFEMAARRVDKGITDYVSLCRPPFGSRISSIDGNPVTCERPPAFPITVVFNRAWLVKGFIV
jgi:hypothetical protein